MMPVYLRCLLALVVVQALNVVGVAAADPPEWTHAVTTQQQPSAVSAAGEMIAYPGRVAGTPSIVMLRMSGGAVVDQASALRDGTIFAQFIDDAGRITVLTRRNATSGPHVSAVMWEPGKARRGPIRVGSGWGPQRAEMSPNGDILVTLGAPNRFRDAYSFQFARLAVGQRWTKAVALRGHTKSGRLIGLDPTNDGKLVALRAKKVSGDDRLSLIYRSFGPAHTSHPRPAGRVHGTYFLYQFDAGPRRVAALELEEHNGGTTLIYVPTQGAASALDISDKWNYGTAVARNGVADYLFASNPHGLRLVHASPDGFAAYTFEAVGRPSVLVNRRGDLLAVGSVYDAGTDLTTMRLLRWPISVDEPDMVKVSYACADGEAILPAGRVWLGCTDPDTGDAVFLTGNVNG